MIKILVCGGRDYKDQEKVYATLDKIAQAKGDVFVIQGGMTGADKLAADWAASRGFPCAEVVAHWDYFGKAAGPKRNLWMTMLGPQGVVAFPGGDGTAGMKAIARDLSIPVMEVA